MDKNLKASPRPLLKERDSNEVLFTEAQKHFVGGVNSPVRSFKSVGGGAPFISKGKGSKIYDANGREYIDFVLSYGPLILGHANSEVINAVKKQAK